MKKILSLIMCVAMLLTACCVSFSVSAEDSALKIEVASASAKPGETVALDVMVTENPGVASAVFSYKAVDSTGAAVEGITVEVDESSTEVFKTSEFTLGKNIVILAEADSKKLGKLVTLNVTVADTVALGEYTVQFIARSVANDEEQDVACEIIDGSGTLTVSVDVTGVTLDKTELAIFAGAEDTLTATVAPANAAQGVTWTSDNEAVATVDAAGKVTAKAEGTATITATSVVDATKSASCVVTVTCNHVGGTATCKDKAICTTCNQAYGELNPANHAGTVSTAYTTDGDNHWHVYECCGANSGDTAAHTGGTAYCNALAICETCGASYGQYNAANHAGNVSTAYTTDSDNHWHAYECCGANSGDTAPHTYSNSVDRDCNDCGATRNVGQANVQVVDKRANPFTDIKVTDSYYNAVEYVYIKGLFKGETATTFAPKATMTRAMFVTVLGRLAGVPETIVTNTTFTDVVASEYYAPYVEWAVKYGIILGYGDGTFGVNDEITVEQMAVIMARYAKYIGVNTNASAKLDTYTDGAKVADWAKAEMQWALEQGIYVPEVSNTIAAKNDAARYMVAEIMYKFVNKFIG